MINETIELSEENAAEIWNQFNQFYDALAVSIVYKSSDSHRLLTIELLVLDLGRNQKRTIVIEAVNPSELRLQECRTCVTVLSDGIRFRKIQNDFYMALSPYSEQMESLEDFRKSDFLFAAPRIRIQM